MDFSHVNQMFFQTMHSIRKSNSLVLLRSLNIKEIIYNSHTRDVENKIVYRPFPAKLTWLTVRIVSVFVLNK